MSDRTSIEWTDATWTPVRARRMEMQRDFSVKERIGWHCEHVSPGCVNCYAERTNRWVGTGKHYKPASLIHFVESGGMVGDVSVFLDEQLLLRPLAWKRPRRIFVCSMTDLFGAFVSDAIIDRVFAVMALAPWHTYQVLTKRARRMREYFEHPAREALIGQQVGQIELARSGNPVSEWSGLPMPHVWLGVTAEDQQRYDERVLDLIGTPAAVRWLSIEPMLGPVQIAPELLAPIEGGSQHGQRFIDWVVCGGESGLQARPMHPDWARSLRDRCAAAGLPFLFKQWGAWAPGENVARTTGHVDAAWWVDDRWMPGRENLARDDGHRDDEPDLYRVGKKAAGRLLDGQVQDGFPEVR